jgi:hypothetical protein
MREPAWRIAVDFDGGAVDFELFVKNILSGGKFRKTVVLVVKSFEIAN